MRSVSSALTTALGAPVQQPAILVEIMFATPKRLSSFAALTWNALNWAFDDVAVDDLAVDALRVSGSLRIGNADGFMGNQVVSEGIYDRAINLWAYDAAATATADVVWLASAVGASAEISNEQVVIQLRHKAEMTLAPRTFVNSDTFGTLLPAGAVLRINGMDMRLQRRADA